MKEEALDKAWDEADETGIAWTANAEKPLVIQHRGRALRLWPEHHDSSGTVQWHVEVEGTRELLGFEAGPDDTEEQVRERVEYWWNAKRLGR